MNFENIKNCVFEAAKAAGIEEYEIFYTSDSSVSVETLKDEISAFAYGVSGGICFRCVIDGKMGSAATELIEEDELRAIVKRAASNARNIESDDPAIIFKGSEKYEKLTAKPFEMPAAAKIKNNALAIQRDTYAQSEYVTDGTQSCAFAGESEMRLVNSYGLDLSNKYGIHGAYIQAVVNKEGEAEEYFELREAIELDELADLPAKAVSGALAKLGATGVASGKYDVVFSAKQVRTLLSTYSPIFSARNAQLGMSLLKGKVGEVVASEKITLIDDPMREGCMAQTSFDGEGVATYKKTVIEGGVLRTLLYDIATAEKEGRESTGNGQRSGYSEPVTIEPYSFYISAGEESFDDMVASLKDGIYITAMKGLHAGADAVTGDFSIDSEGFRIRDGKICEAIKSFTVAGNFFDLLKNIKVVANDLTFGLPSGFTVFGAPSILVPDMSIAGKDEK